MFFRIVTRFCNGSLTGGNLLLLRLHSEPDQAKQNHICKQCIFIALGALVIPLIMAMLNDLKLSFIIIAIFLLIVLINLICISLYFKNANMQNQVRKK